MLILLKQPASFSSLKSSNETDKENTLMSRHPSYGKSSKSAKKRNVLKRFERIDVLKKLGRWKSEENKKVTGLPKTPIIP